MDLRNDYAPRIPGSVPYQLHYKNGLGLLLAAISIGLLALLIRALGLIWRMTISLAQYSTKAGKSAVKTDIALFRNILGKYVLPTLFVMMGYYFFKDWTLVGVRNLSIVTLLVCVLVLTLRSGRKEKGDSK